MSCTRREGETGMGEEGRSGKKVLMILELDLTVWMNNVTQSNNNFYYFHSEAGGTRSGARCSGWKGGEV